MTDQDPHHIWEAIKKNDYTNIKGDDLNLNGIAVTDQDVQHLTKALKEIKNIKQLQLEGVDLNDDILHTIIEVLPKTGINILSLTSTRIGNSGVTRIAKLLSSIPLVSLSLSRSDISHDGAEALMEALQSNKTITKLDLSVNNLGLVNSLYSFLKTNTSLKELSLFRTSQGDQGVKALTADISSNPATSLTILDLSWNGITEDGANALIELLKTNKSLKQLPLTKNTISEYSLNEISTLLQKSDTPADNHNSNTIASDPSNNNLPESPNGSEISVEQSKKLKASFIQLEEKEKKLKSYEQDLTQKDKNLKLREDQFQLLKHEFHQHEESFQKQRMEKEKTLTETEQKLDVQSQQLLQKETQFTQKSKTLSDKETNLTEKEKSLQSQQTQIQKRETLIQNKDTELNQRDKLIREREKLLGENEKNLQIKSTELTQKELQLKQLEAKLLKNQADVEEVKKQSNSTQQDKQKLEKENLKAEKNPVKNTTGGGIVSTWSGNAVSYILGVATCLVAYYLSKGGK